MTPALTDTRRLMTNHHPRVYRDHDGADPSEPRLVYGGSLWRESRRRSRHTSPLASHPPPGFENAADDSAGPRTCASLVSRPRRSRVARSRPPPSLPATSRDPDSKKGAAASNKHFKIGNEIRQPSVVQALGTRPRASVPRGSAPGRAVVDQRRDLASNTLTRLPQIYFNNAEAENLAHTKISPPLAQRLVAAHYRRNAPGLVRTMCRE